MAKRCWAKLALVAAFAAAVGGVGAPTAGANTGDVLATAAAAGAGAAFDGRDLYYTDAAGTLLHRVAPDGVSDAQDTAIVGAAGLQALSYDLTRNVFWAVDSTGLTVYTVDKTGLALLQFAINPVTDLPGTCGTLTGCSTTIADLAYDATDDSLWYLPSGSNRIYHLDTAGNALGYLDVGSLGCSSASGVAAAESALFVTACGRVIEASKTDIGTSTALASLAAPTPNTGEAECDDATFAPADALWVRDETTGSLRAVQIPNGSCRYGGGVYLDPMTTWMSGGGKVFEAEAPRSATGAVEVHFGFMLHCTTLFGVSVTGRTTPNSLNITWGKNNGFHLEIPATQACDGSTASSPTTIFNHLHGTGTGHLRVNGQTEGGSAEWDFVDNDDPGNVVAAASTSTTPDDVFLHVTDSQGDVLLTIPGCTCFQGNVQAHQQG